MNVFIAGSSLRRAEIRELYADLYAAGHTGYDWTKDIGYDDLSRFDQLTSAMADLTAVDACDALVWYLDGATSHGAPFEAGYARAKGKTVVALWGCLPNPLWIYAYTANPRARTLEEALALAARAYVDRKSVAADMNAADLRQAYDILNEAGIPGLFDAVVETSVGCSPVVMAKTVVAGRQQKAPVV